MELLLTDKELELLQDKNVFKLKSFLTKKLEAKLAVLEELLHNHLKNGEKRLPLECYKLRGKITKGENLVEFPWMVLDYPRVFNRDKIFAVRTLIWWGRYITVSLVLTGTYSKKLAPYVLRNAKRLHGAYISVSGTPWVHEVNNKTSVKAQKLTTSQKESVLEKEFIKVFFKIPLSQIQDLDKQVLKRFEQLINLVERN